jgi:Tfp pilus assembly PilM family ATPase
VLFCKSQVKISGLKLDRVLLCGGGAAIRGLPRYLSSGMNVPVEMFDAFRVVNTDALAPEVYRYFSPGTSTHPSSSSHFF